MGRLIYLLEDDESIRKLVVYALSSQGYEARGFEAPETFWRAMAEETPELVLLDIMLPEEDGLSILRRLRAAPGTASLPVVMLTARDAEFDRVEGLDAGADDYISKPFGMMELLARLRAVLRRTGRAPVETVYHCGAVRLWPERREAQVSGEPVHLTNKEFSLLCLMVEHPGQALTRDILIDRVWGPGADRENRTLDVHIRTLRAKLGRAGDQIETVRGVGYRIIGGTQHG